jgi:hypothetical protein
MMMRALPMLVVAGCLSVPSKLQPACTSDSDCNTAGGEVCDEGVCYGDPPMGMFAATLGPPSDRTDIVQSEMPALAIPSNGWLGDVVMPAPVTISGRVEAFCPGTMTCSDASLPATITVTRAPRFPGGPGFHAIVDAKDGIARGSTSFALGVPASVDGDAQYVVTIMPDGRAPGPPTNGTTAPAEIAPPKRVVLAAPSDLPAMTFTLGSADAPIISGSLSDGNGHALTHYRVVALGRWDASDVPTEVSTIDYTANGSFAITLADGIYGNVEIVATPYDPNVVAPTLHLPNVAPQPAQKLLSAPPSLGNPITITIPVTGVSGSGQIAPVAGARVILHGSYNPSLSGGAHADLDTEVTTGDDGIAKLTVLDGSAFSGYALRVIPPVSSTLGIVFDQMWSLDQSGAEIRLAPRIALRGTLKDTRGNPIGNASVTARPSLRFRWSLLPAAQDFLTQIPVPTAVTTDSGDFVVWVDPFLGATWGTYDLDIEPASGDDVPSWTVSGIDIPRAGQTAVALGNVPVPDAANIHGRITDPAGNPVEGGELRVFSLSTDATAAALCDSTDYHPTACVIPAQQVGHGASDADGTVRLTLPRP